MATTTYYDAITNKRVRYIIPHRLYYSIEKSNNYSIKRYFEDISDYVPEYVYYHTEYRMFNQLTTIIVNNHYYYDSDSDIYYNEGFAAQSYNIFFAQIDMLEDIMNNSDPDDNIQLMKWKTPLLEDGNCFYIDERNIENACNIVIRTGLDKNISKWSENDYIMYLCLIQ